MAEERSGVRPSIPSDFAVTNRVPHARSALWPVLLAGLLLCLLIAIAHPGRVATTMRRAFLTAPVFANRSDGYDCFRIPAVVQLPDGTLLAFAEGRKNNCSDFGDIQIGMRRSKDGGKHWSRFEVVANNGRLQTGNPAPVVDTVDTRYPRGRVFLFYTTSDVPEDDLVKGHGSARVWYRTSTDGGATWALPVEITASVKLPSWGNYGTAPGHALQLSSGPHRGRIFVPGFHTEGPPKPDQSEVRAQGFYSDDHGQTWHLGDTVAYPAASESTAAQAADGSLVMNSRDESGASKGRIVSVSTSGGERWDKTFVAHDLPDPACEGSMVAYTPPGHAPVLLFSNLLNTNPDRHGLAVSESTDGGRTWPKHKVIYKGSSQYSDIVAMPDGVLGILYERENDGIVFEKRRIADLF